MMKPLLSLYCMCLVNCLLGPSTAYASALYEAEHASSAATAPPINRLEVISDEDFIARMAAWRAEQTERCDRVPIFVITCDRTTVFKRSMLSYVDVLAHPVDIVVFDNNSTYGPMVDLLGQLERAGVRVIRSGRTLRDATELDVITESITRYMEGSKAEHYVVTDPDIELEETSGDILEVFAHLLEMNPHIQAVGPMLRRDDLPAHYPLRDRVRSQQAEVYAGQAPYTIVWNDAPLQVQPGLIDTAFAMYRRGFVFHRYNVSLQTYDPYQARHLDWYLDPRALELDQQYYLAKRTRSATGARPG
jgi:hypothetical protein